MKKEIFSYVQKYIEKNCDCPFEVEPSDSLNAYFDSIDKVIFFADLEERYSVNPSFEEELECEYLMDICELIEKKIKEK